MLTAQEFETYKGKLSAAERELSVLEARKQQAIEQLRTEFGLSLEQAGAELARLESELPRLEEEFGRAKQEFDAKWADTIGR